MQMYTKITKQTMLEKTMRQSAGKRSFFYRRGTAFYGLSKGIMVLEVGIEKCYS